MSSYYKLSSARRDRGNLVNFKSGYKHDFGTRRAKSFILGAPLRAIGVLGQFPNLQLWPILILISGIYRGGYSLSELLCLLFILSFLPVLAKLGGDLDVTGRRYLSRDPGRPEDLHDKSYVLYLRAFENDSVLGKPETKSSDIFPSLSGSYALYNSMSTAEEQIVQALAPVGPVVALGQPGESPPLAGALRMYSDKIGRGWLELVRELMEHASLVVLGAGVGRPHDWKQSLISELSEAVQRVHPHRLVILVYLGKPEYDDFRKAAEARLLIRLPDFPFEENWDYNDRVRGWFIWFDYGWFDHNLVARQVILKADMTERNRIRKGLNAGLGPVFQRISKIEAGDGPRAGTGNG